VGSTKGETQADRPLIAVARAALETDRTEASAHFTPQVGMHLIFQRSTVSAFALDGGTDLILLGKDAIAAGIAPFALMVDDLHASHPRFSSVALAPSAIKPLPAVAACHDYLLKPRFA
jgi:hypothetical protein